MYRINKSINSPSLVDHVILVHAQFHNRLKLCDYKGNLKVECAILPLLNANMLLVFVFIMSQWDVFMTFSENSVCILINLSSIMRYSINIRDNCLLNLWNVFVLKDV